MTTDDTSLANSVRGHSLFASSRSMHIVRHGLYGVHVLLCTSMISDQSVGNPYGSPFWQLDLARSCLCFILLLI
jgi:hypothetical protein